MKNPCILASLTLLFTVSASAARSLEDAVAKLDQRPGKGEVAVAFTGVVTGFAENEDLVVASEQRIIVVDLPREINAAQFPVGSRVRVQGELEHAPKWRDLGTRFEVDADTVTLVSESPTPTTPASTRQAGANATSNALSLDNAIALLRENRRMDDIPVSFNAVVTSWQDEDEMTVEVSGTRVRVDLPYGQHAISFPVGSQVAISGTLDRRAWVLPGPRFEVYARTLSLRPAAEALP